MGKPAALLNYVRIGDGEPLIILHGLFGSSKNWQSLSKVFARHFDVLTIDLRNHGLSFHDEVMDYPAMVDDVVRLIAHLEIKSCRLLGHSMGGKVGMLLALNYPRLVSQLVVADIAPINYTHDYNHLIDPLIALNLEHMESRSAVEKALQSDIPDLQLRHFLLQSLMRCSDADSWRWKNNWIAIKQNIDKITGFPESPVFISAQSSKAASWRVSTPTLFVNGENSDYLNKYGKTVINQHFDAPHFETLKNANHWLHAEQPERFSEKVLNYLLD